MHTIRTRIESAKKFAKENALPLASAAATIVTAVAVVKLNRTTMTVLRVHDDNMNGNQAAVERAEKEGLDYTYFPGLGVYVRGPKDAPATSD